LVREYTKFYLIAKKNVFLLKGSFIAIFIALSSCSSSDDEQNNSDYKLSFIMDSRVVSYKQMLNECFTPPDCFYAGGDGNFNNEQAESKCNYFAILLKVSSGFTDYWILSQEMILHHIGPGRGVNCPITWANMYHIMLVCDDTEDGNLKDRIDLNSIQSYTDPNWDCEKQNVKKEDVFF